MASNDPHQIDAKSGMSTTGHDWDGIRELNTPLPRWWLWLFYATIVWSIGYWIFYPAWPLVSSYSKGAFGWQSRSAVTVELADLKIQRGPVAERLAAASLQEIVSDPQLTDFARAQGRRAFADNCAPCHGAGGGGGKGYPNLNDDDWLWGGKLEDIAVTIRHGIRSDDNQGRVSMMPDFGHDGQLKRDDVEAVADFVRSRAGLPAEPKADLERGGRIFAERCSVCHGQDGKGNRQMGAPNLTDSIWLYGADRAAIVETIWNGRGGVMPAWDGRLDEPTIKALTVFVHTLGGGER
jgi:cytochrome c oxidase cbb3-type subunit 3